MNELTWAAPAVPQLNRPVLVVSFSGLFDAAEVATSATSWLSTGRVVETLAMIDPDGFFDFQQHRPTVALVDDHRVLSWPTNEFFALRDSSATHDVIVLTGVEPDVRWRTFVDAIVEVVTTSKCELVVTVGAIPEAIPHTRTPVVFGSTATPGLATKLGLSRPQYQGPTGVVGVLHERLESLDIPTVALRVGVPHYLTNARHPRSTAALLRHLEHVLGFPTNHAGLEAEIDQWLELHERAVASDAQAFTFVKMMERDFDRRAELAVPSADDLGAAFEEFLKEQRERGDDSPA